MLSVAGEKLGSRLATKASRCPVLTSVRTFRSIISYFNGENNSVKATESESPRNYDSACPFANMKYFFEDYLAPNGNKNGYQHAVNDTKKKFVSPEKARPKNRNALPKEIEQACIAKLDVLKQAGNYREFIDVERHCGDFPKATWRYDGKEKEVVVWCNNDYLGQGQNKYVMRRCKRALDSNGLGAGGTRNISGTSNFVTYLEAELATMHEKEAALVFNSGYIANQASLGTFPQLLKDCVIISDSLNHASMIHGIRESKCEKVIWKHNDLKHLEEILKKYDISRPKLIAFESIRSFETKQMLEQAGLPVIWSESHIVPLMVGDAALCKKASDRLLHKHGIYVQPINYPTVPVGTERFRLTPTPFHTTEMIHKLVNAVEEVWNHLHIPRTIPQIYANPNQPNIDKVRPALHTPWVEVETVSTPQPVCALELSGDKCGRELNSCEQCGCLQLGLALN